MFGPSITCKLIRYILFFLFMKLMLTRAFEQEHYDLQPIWPAFPNHRFVLVLKRVTWTLDKQASGDLPAHKGGWGGEMEVEFLRCTYILSLFPCSTESSCHPCHHRTSLYIFAIFLNLNMSMRLITSREFRILNKRNRLG